MYLPIVLHSLRIIQILMFFNARSNLGALGGFTVATIRKHDFVHILYLNSQSIFPSLLFIAESEETAPKGGGRSGNQQLTVVSGFWSFLEDSLHRISGTT